jgi:putative ABC transport system permease protein
MIRVANKKIIRKLADRSLKAGRSRNIIAASAIALTAILFTTLFTLGIGSIESFQQATMRQAGGDVHATVKYITDKDFNKLKSHKLIKEIAYTRMLSNGAVKNEVFLKRHTELWYMDDAGMRHGFCEPTNGHKPMAANEIVTDTKTLMLLGVPQEAGAPLTLSLDIHGREVKREFILAGWWESDPAYNVGMIVTSRAYVDVHEEELQSTYKKDFSLTGIINAQIMFENSFNLEGKLDTVLTDSGYSLDSSAGNYLEHNVNWAYLNTSISMDAGSVLALLGGLLLVIFTGYLIIYNIFQISVIRDIQFYGLLKTIGTTGRQIRRIIHRQAMLLSISGIPTGLIIGFFTGRSLVPLIISQSSLAGTTVSVSPSPWIFAGSALFAIVTVMISTYKPGKIAAAVSPVEAVRYTEGGAKQKGRLKKSTDGARTPRMAFSNLGRNKKRTVLVIISLSLSLVLLNTVFTLSRGIDMDKYLSKFVDTDFLIAHAEYFQDKYEGPSNETTESFIRAVENQPGFENGGRLYGGYREMFTVEDKKNTAQKYNINEYGHFITAMYGLDDLPMQRLELIDGELDYTKLASGKYILEGVQLDDYEAPEMGSVHFAVGDTVTIHNYKGTSEKNADREYTTQKFTVLGHVAIKRNSNSDRRGWGYTFYLPAGVYKPLVARPAVMSYAYNVEDAYEAEMNAFLKNYTEKVEPVMNYTSKLTSLNEFAGMRNSVVMIGGALSFIIGLVGILNFFNAILTSILTRRREFAVLQGIGMTGRQLRSMLCWEGVYYAVGTCVLSLVIGTVFSLFVVRALCSQMWFFSYHFVIWPLMIVLPVLFLLGIAIPLASYAMTDRQSIVERLRTVE